MLKKLFSQKGGLQRKAIRLVLILVLVTAAVFFVLFTLMERSRERIIREATEEQQGAIAEISGETMQEMLESSLVKMTEMQARIANNDFTEIVNYVYMLQSMAHSILKNNNQYVPTALKYPNPELEGLPSAYVLAEKGVDYRMSKLLPTISTMSRPMIAMFTNSDKIDSCFIGLEDGTDLCVDAKPRAKYDENGKLIPFQVRQRPWYRGALAASGLFFTGLEKDAFTGVPLVTCSMPIVLGADVMGVVGVDIEPTSMMDFINSANDNGGFAYIINSTGDVLLGPDENPLFSTANQGVTHNISELANKDLTNLVTKALESTTELTTITIKGKDYYMAGSPMPTVGWTVISAIEKEIPERPGTRLSEEYERIIAEAKAAYTKRAKVGQRSMMATVLGLLIASLAIAALMMKRIVHPIVEMTDDVANSGEAGENFEMKDIYRTHDEIEVLAESFDDLSKKTKKYIRELTAATREKERVKTELNTAKNIQAGVLPHVFPAFPDRTEFELYASMDPAREVGGDFYDYYLIDDDHLALVMADVSGKGVPAALFMMVSMSIIRGFAMQSISPSEILKRTNATLCANNQADMFVTVWIGILELSTGKLTASNAGHEYPFLKKAGVGYDLFKDKHGLVLGTIDGVPYTDYEIQIEKGDQIFVYTDGVPEATAADKSMFTTERLKLALNKDQNANPEQVLKNVTDAVNDFVKDAEQFDDITMLCLEYYGAGEEKD